MDAANLVLWILSFAIIRLAGWPVASPGRFPPTIDAWGRCDWHPFPISEWRNSIWRTSCWGRLWPTLHRTIVNGQIEMEERPTHHQTSSCDRVCRWWRAWPGHPCKAWSGRDALLQRGRSSQPANAKTGDCNTVRVCHGRRTHDEAWWADEEEQAAPQDLKGHFGHRVVPWPRTGQR